MLAGPFFVGCRVKEGWMDFAIAGVAIIPLVLGIVEFAKKFGVEGKGSLALVVILGFVFSGLAYAFDQGLIPEVATPWISLVVVALAGGLAAAGLYDLGKRFAGMK
jgi:hypothetical protein